MKKIDLFFVVALILFSALATAYMSFDYHLSGVALHKKKNEILENKISQLNLVVETMQAKTNPKQRGIASIGSSSKAISLDPLYKQQMRAARINKDSQKVLDLAQKIISESIDSDSLAEAYFAKAEVSCATYLKKENTCLSDIEVLISQFPDSVWAGEGLIVLSWVYAKQKRYKEAESLIGIVKSEFSGQKKLISKAQQIEKSML